MESLFTYTLGPLGYFCIATATVFMLLSQHWSNIWFRISRAPKPSIHTSSTVNPIAEHVEVYEQWHSKDSDDAHTDELKLLKRLYYQLHNIEKFPDALPQAKTTLLRLLMETGITSQGLPENENSLSVQSFSRQALEEFQRKRDINIGKRWQDYVLRRNEGGARELFEDRDEAIWWLKQIAPIKYVDGAWLGHVAKVTTPFALQKTMKGAWQILSEELGDGDLAKNHVFLYHKLLEKVAPGFPTADTIEFGDPEHGLNEISVWKSAIAQLLVSLFPSEFLPEILGFNLHFEAVSMDTLKAAKELKEVGIDPYYFILHISIDNADSGHTAIAIDVACEYMNCILEVEGEEAAQRAWKRIQTGYMLSVGLPGTVVCPSRMPMDESRVILNPIEMEVIRIFKAKAQVVHGIHCSSKIKIGSRTITEWLEPTALESKRWQLELLNSLSCAKYWIRRGDSSKSRFIHELQWNGRMFGSFTQDEYDILRKWIDGLSEIPQTPNIPYQIRDSSNLNDETILSGYPEFRFSHSPSPRPAKTLFSFRDIPPLNIGGRPTFDRFLPLWLSHPCLLQEFVSTPWRTKNNFACTIVKILRAQLGFDIEQECVAGMSEVRRPNSLGLAGVGKNMMAQQGLSLNALPSLKHVLQICPSEFAVYMLRVSMKPIECKGMLIGMATAFAKMHAAIVSSQLCLLSTQDQLALQNISIRELKALELCWEELQQSENVFADCCEGYLTAKHEIEICFQL
ncbi:hypothetical protein HYALB_00009090 [Hymenoscyphus albidus]|uniref:Uncharacterized protein n=1 Tax=Hymenoscyphus albidus TaxID=595503 RepID=A0A9N9LQI6_9HELO|nr:hypothetical protein HYALB_00009090 [Hymenoscyphus albidus]